MEKISINQLKKRGAPQLGHAPQQENIWYLNIVANFIEIWPLSTNGQFGGGGSLVCPADVSPEGGGREGEGGGVCQPEFPINFAWLYLCN